MEGPKCHYAPCGKELSWRQRSDALYCSGKCRVASHRERHKEAVQLYTHKLGFDIVWVAERSSLAKAKWLAANFQFFETGWSKPFACVTCGWFSTRVLKMMMRGKQQWWPFCSFGCIARAPVTVRAV
jgi:hypothetical protein